LSVESLQRERNQGRLSTYPNSGERLKKSRAGNSQNSLSIGYLNDSSLALSQTAPGRLGLMGKLYKMKSVPIVSDHPEQAL
jgi:hypothetical protein